jgi:hypothetical protein
MREESITITAHYAARARQRGYRSEDLAIMERLATAAEDGILLRTRDVQHEIEWLSSQLRHIRRRKTDERLCQAEIEIGEYEIVQQIERLQRLPGAFVPLENGHALSIYRPSRRRLKHILRGGRMPRRDRRYWR